MSDGSIETRVSQICLYLIHLSNFLVFLEGVFRDSILCLASSISVEQQNNAPSYKDNSDNYNHDKAVLQKLSGHLDTTCERLN